MSDKRTVSKYYCLKFAAINCDDIAAIANARVIFMGFEWNSIGYLSRSLASVYIAMLLLRSRGKRNSSLSRNRVQLSLEQQVSALSNNIFHLTQIPCNAILDHTITATTQWMNRQKAKQTVWAAEAIATETFDKLFTLHWNYINSPVFWK